MQDYMTGRLKRHALFVAKNRRRNIPLLVKSVQKFSLFHWKVVFITPYAMEMGCIWTGHAQTRLAMF